ncbi:MAG: YhcH/YjgK/YiaL family protein [Spirochaetaceae bacterium]|nr:MAG: YhcH/YjgK/YiaL family protein [Spirochaetaceae bacterium]
MILDMLANSGRYRGISSVIEKALAYLTGTSFAALEDGRYPIDGEEVYAILTTYDTEPERNRRFEAHRAYLDVQCILSGREIMFWAPETELTPASEYSQEKDVLFLAGEARARLQLIAGSFAVFYPEDAHKPNCAWDEPEQVRKVVVKVRAHSS